MKQATLIFKIKGTENP